MKKPRVTFYRDAKKEWRWRVRGRNGKVLADSGEGYSVKLDCEHGALLVTALLAAWVAFEAP